MSNILDTPTGELAVKNPAASRIFHRYRIDYCCGGKRPLRESCVAAGADPEAVARDLLSIDIEPTAENACWDTQPLLALVTHLRVNFHEPLRQELARLRFMAQKVGHVHGGHQPNMVVLAALFTRFAEDIEQHLHIQGQILFPLILNGQADDTASPINAMHNHHELFIRHLASIRDLCCGFQPWTGACNTVRALFLGLEQLDDTLRTHINLENNVLFPRVLART